MKMPAEKMQKARAWIMRNARPLEAARWQYFFENGSRQRVLFYLSAFQNADGGFGHGIEPDFWLPYSSPTATWAASQIIREVHAAPEQTIVENMVKYLVETPQIYKGMWSSVLPENNEYAHAPWWHWQEGVQENWMFNPSVELAAFIIAMSPVQSHADQIGWQTLQEAVPRLMDAREMDRHELNNYRNFVEIIKPYEAVFNSRMNYSLEEVERRVNELVLICIDRDVANWATGYRPLPLDFINHPEEPLARELRDLVERNLKFYVEQVSDEGIWDISWEWEHFPAEFAVARRYWQGILAIQRYRTLKAFNWIL